MKFSDKVEGRRLSAGQSAIWFAQMLDAGSPAFNIAEYIEIEGALNPVVFETALLRVISETEALQVRIKETEEGPRQFPATDVEWRLQFFDVSGESHPHAVAEAWMREDLGRAINPGVDPLFVYALFRIAPARFLWYIRYHHLCMDGFGGALVARRAAEVYSALAEERSVPARTFATPAELLEEEARYQRVQGERDREYWRELFRNRADTATLSGRQPARSRQFIRCTGFMPQFLVQSLTWAGKQNGATFAQLIEAVAGFYLHRLTGASDLALGIPLTARVGREMRRTPGLVSNILPLRLEFSGTDTFDDLLKQVAKRKKEMLKRQRYRSEDLRRDLGLSPADPEIYGMLVNVMPFDYDLTFAGSRAKVHNISNGPVDELAVVLYDRQDGSDVRIDFDANPAHYTQEQLSAHQQRFLALLEQMVTPEQPLHHFSVLLPHERHMVLETFNSTAHFVPAITLPLLFEQQVERTPHATALVFREELLSYAQLNAQSNQLAHYLVGTGIGPDSRVGICLPRSVGMLVAMLAVLKAGAAYVPLDPEYPPTRLAGMLEDAKPECVLSNSGLLPLLPQDQTVLALDSATLMEALECAPDGNLSDSQRCSALRPKHTAYVIYTSGSTGRPKGVTIEHRSVATFIAWSGSVFNREEWAGVLASTSICFDLSVFELFATLSHGGTVLLAHSALELPELAAKDQVRLINTVPSAARALLDSTGLPPRVRTINLAGEALPDALVQDLYRLGHIERVYNLYGPSEDTTYSTFALCTRGPEQGITIGSPVWNTRVYVLDSCLQPLPSGASGELYVSGSGLARGYFGQPRATAERFVADPFAAPGSRMYRTGDIARWRPNGTLEFLGRADHQVKIRGFRIELGEIEAALTAHPEVRQTIVATYDSGPSGKQLVAYLVPTDRSGFDLDDIQRSLSQSLPTYMLPDAFVVIDELPLTPNGKIDRQALPAPEWRGQRYTAPRTAEEEILCQLFAEVLSRDHVGIHDSFFELGGHSLMAMRLLSRVRAAFNVELPTRVLFDSPSVAQLAPHVAGFNPTLLPDNQRSRPERLPLSYSQQRLWFIDQLEGSSTQYHIPEALRLCGDLNVSALHQAINVIVERHESLRTHFVQVDGESVQVIEQKLVLDLPMIDFSLLTKQRQQEEVRAAMRQEWEQPFDLGRGPLLRVKLLKLSQHEHILLRTFHHIIADGWSEDVFNGEMAAVYEAFCEGHAHSLPPLPMQYADFVLWQRDGQQAAKLSADLKYWKEQLSGIPEELELARDRLRPARQTFGGSMVHSTLPAKRLADLQRLGQQNSTTLYMTLAAGFALLLQRYSGQKDIVTGSPIASRPDVRLEQLVGYFANVIVMRTRIEPAQTFRDLLTQVRDAALDAYRHQDIPFEQLLDQASPQRSLNRPPIFQVMFALQNAPGSGQRLTGLVTEQLLDSEPQTRLDLELYAWQRGLKLEFYWVYRQDLFDRWRIEQMARHFDQLLQSAAASPDTPLHQLAMITHAERQQLLIDWNRTEAIYPAPECIHHLFERWASETPEAVAAELGDRRMSYGELNVRANQLAHYLRKLEIGPEARVGVCMERSLDLLCALMGVLKAGGAYVPLDPAYPSERLAYMLRDCRADVVLTQREQRHLLPRDTAAVIELDSTWEMIANEPQNCPAMAVGEANLAYLIYTSGSTGPPKGVAVEHRQVRNQLFWAGEALAMTPADRVLQKASFSFDASILEIFLPLAWGACIVIARPGSEQDPDYLVKLAHDRAVTYLDLAPALLEALLDHPLIQQWISLRTVSSGAETLSPQLVRTFYQKLSAELWNTYGPTETTVQSTFAKCSPGASVVAIGKPIANTCVYVLDEHLDLNPVGVEGELYIGGAGVTRGYWSRPELTAEKFVPDPFSWQGGERLYRTGDRVRWLRDGNLEFLGRVDQQVKIRGFRIELGEIAAALKAHESVNDALVVVHDRDTGKHLVAYVIAQAWEGDADSKLRAKLEKSLRRSLPGYMVPAAIIVLPSWPLNPNGKIDRRALPLPDQRTDGQQFPCTPQEEVLSALFAGVLGVERVGRQDNFFELGGHSLLAARLVSRIRSSLGVELEIRTLFESPSVAELAERLGDDRPMPPPLVPQPRPERLPLSYAQQRLWFLYRMEGPSATYNIPLALRLEGELDEIALEQALADVVARHETLRTIFPEVDGVPYQHVLPAEGARPKLIIENVSESELDAQLAAAASTAIEIDREMPLMTRLFSLGLRSHVLLFLVHHIAGDGWSLMPLARDVEQAYSARKSGEVPEFKPLPVQYADYVAWQRTLLGEESDVGSLISQQIEFWRKALEGAPEELNLPNDRPRPSLASYRGDVVRLEVGAELHRSLLRLARDCGATLFMVLQAALAALLSRQGAGEDIPLGTVVAGRGEACLEELVGFFVNTLVMRIDISGRPSFIELIGRVRRFALNAYAHQDAPFERLVEALQPARSQARHPVFQVMLVLQSAPQPKIELPGLTASGITISNGTAKFDLLFTFNERLDIHGQAQGLHLDLEFGLDIFERTTAETFAARLLQLLAQAVAMPQAPLHQLEILTAEERRTVLQDFNATAHSVPWTTLTALLERQAERTPDSTAVLFGNESLTYAELNERSNRMAHYFISQGAGPESLVGIALERSFEMVVALLATLKAGAAYLPLDPEYPQARLAQMLDDADPKLVLTSRKVRVRLPQETSLKVVELGTQETEKTLRQQPTHNPDDLERVAPLLPQHPAYAIYTSGSTGIPKGAVITHNAIVNRLLWMQATYNLTSADRVLQKTPFSFDVSVWEFFWPLLEGATLVLTKPEGHKDAAYLAGLIQTAKVTAVHFVPSMLQAFMQEPQAAECRSLQRVICSGEALSQELQQRFFEILPVALHNLYGPTEAAVDVSFWQCRKEPDRATVPIGRPIWNTRIYVLDPNL
ncbi:MAG TPA: amino acid adenylation domain-containing protein, partial [Candidatus Solibacter sp.]|nr:amino acid adenylation domain-containing protein [Candidatus Solibacter sp.]